MLKFYIFITFYIFLNYGSCLIQKKHLGKYNHFKNDKEKGDTIEDLEKGNSRKYRVSRILSSSEDISSDNESDHFDISKLKNLLVFQSNLDDQMQKRKREEKKMRKIKEAIKKGNIVSDRKERDINKENDGHIKETQNREMQTPITETNIHDPKEIKKNTTKNKMHQNLHNEEKVMEPTENRESIKRGEQTGTLQNEDNELFSNGFNQIDEKSSIASTLAKNLSTLSYLSKNDIYTEENLAPIHKSIKKHNPLEDIINKEQEKVQEKFEKQLVEKKENEKQSPENGIAYIDEEYRSLVDSPNTKHKKLHEDILNIVEEKAKKKNLNLRKNDLHELLDVHELVQKIKTALGIKTNIHEKLSYNNLILKDCNYESLGPDYCSVDSEAKYILEKFEQKKSSVLLVIIIFTLLFSFFVQSIVHIIEKHVKNSKDQFRKDLLNTAFRQISLITIINLTIWGILQTNIAEALDDIIFGDILPNERNIDNVLHNVEPLLEKFFEKILLISFNFLMCYSIFIISIHFMTRRILIWFSKADTSDVMVVVKQMNQNKRKCFGNCCLQEHVRNANFLAHRYDFSDNVDAISIPGLDPNGYYYYEYMRACLLKYIVKLIKIPNTVILFLIFTCISLKPFFNIRLKQEVILLNCLSIVCILGLITLFIYVFNIDRKLMPANVSQFLTNAYHVEVGDPTKREVIPYYKLTKQQSVYPSPLNYFIYKTTFPNKHEQLFLFWGNGPCIINFIFQTLCYCFLIVVSCWLFLLRFDSVTWFKLYSVGSVAIGCCIFFFFLILKYIIYFIVMITKTGYLIDTKLLEKVWEYERSDNIKRISEFIDAIKIKSTLHALKEGGDVFWRQLSIKASTVPPKIHEKMLGIWTSLDEENRGIIYAPKILKFLKSQGINLVSEDDIQEFLDVFDRTNKKGLNQEEFFVLILIVKQILVELLDINAVQSLFEEVYATPWKSPSAIDVNSLKKILDALNLSWPHGKIRNLIDFVCENKKTKFVSSEYFIKQLINIEEVTLQPFHSPSDSK